MENKLETWRAEAAAIIEEMAPLKAQLHVLQRRHAQLAWDIEAESRKQTAVRKIARGVSGKPSKRRKINTDAVAKQFTNLPASVQAQLIKELHATI